MVLFLGVYSLAYTVVLIGHCHSVVSVVPENPEIKASAVFRSQLMTPHNANGPHLPMPDDLARLKPDQVQVVAKEPRVGTRFELMRIALKMRILQEFSLHISAII